MGVPAELVEELTRLGGWRTLQSANGERPLDIAERRGHSHLLGILEPVLNRCVPFDVLLKTQHRFHDVILGRAGDLVRCAALRLPELEPLLELGPQNVWFGVPGMYGGFPRTFSRTASKPCS